MNVCNLGVKRSQQACELLLRYHHPTEVMAERVTDLIIPPCKHKNGIDQWPYSKKKLDMHYLSK